MNYNIIESINSKNYWIIFLHTVNGSISFVSKLSVIKYTYWKYTKYNYDLNLHRLLNVLKISIIIQFR